MIRSGLRAGPRNSYHGLLAASAALVLVGCGTPATEPAAQRPSQQYDAATFYDTTSVFGSSFSADESKILMTSDRTGTFNVYSQPVAGGEPVALTESTGDSYLAVSYFPSDDRFLYSADQGGDELNHLYVQELDGSVRDLTPGDNIKAGFAGWSGDRQHFYVTSNERDPRFIDLYRYTTDGYQRELIFRNDGYFVSEVSRDGQQLALFKINSNDDSDVFLRDLETGVMTLVTPHEGAIQHQVVAFTPDGSRLYYSTNGESEFDQVWSYELASGEREAVIVADWDVSSVGFSETGRYRVTAVNADAQTEISILDTEAGEDLELPDLGDGDLSGVSFSRSEEKMAFYLNSDTSPSDLYVLDLQNAGDPRRLTRSLSAKIDPADLVESEVVRFSSFDGLEIPGILYRPLQASSDSPVPVVLSMHGGPGGQSRKGYNASHQHLLNHGYGVFAVNNRGSSGYGKTFHHLDDRQHGEVDLKDCVSARRYLETLEWVDGDRIGIMGGSYGGYLVVAALAFEPEAFEVGIDIFGVTNWLRTLQSIPPWWTAQRESLYGELGDPATDADRLRRISPLFHADNIRKPLLVIQGANDPRVLQVESDEIVEAVRKNGVPVEYIVFPDEGHGFRKKANRIAASEAFVGFLDAYLKGSAEATGATPPVSGTAANAGAEPVS